MSDLRTAALRARDALALWSTGRDMDAVALNDLIAELDAALAELQTADDLREPKNGAKWRVEWWNESCRMMLPEDRKLDSFVSYKNGTLQITIKRTPT